MANFQAVVVSRVEWTLPWNSSQTMPDVKVQLLIEYFPPQIAYFEEVSPASCSIRVVLLSHISEGRETSSTVLC